VRTLGGLALLGFIACGDPEPAAEEPPAYARSDFGTLPAGDVETAIRLADVTAAAGIDFVHATGAFGAKWMPETMGSGVAFLDYDTDGWPDLFLVNGTAWDGHPEDRGATSRLYRNRGDGTFTDVTVRAGLDRPIYGMGVAAADFDGDGDPDLYVTAVGDNRLYRNDGGRFIDVTAATGTAGNRPGATEGAWSTAAAWLDVDRDGWLDLFVCNYVRWTPETDLFTTYDGVNKGYATPLEYHGESCRLLANREGRRFDDVTTAAGLENPDGKSLGIVTDDFNGDGWLDIAVANDTYQNFLYLNQGDGTFRDAALKAGVAFDEFGRARAGMGIDVADVTNRGRLSIGIGNFSNEPVALYTQIGSQSGESLFQDLAGAARITRATMLPLTFGLRFADLDLDRYADLILGNGHIEPDIQSVEADVTFAQPPILLHNDGRGGFADVSEHVGGGFQEPIVARGIATADIDRDGDLDLIVTTNGGRAKLFRTDLPSDATWVRVILEGRRPNREAIGALVEVFVDGQAERFRVATSSGYLSQSETNPVVAGLGGAAAADSIVVVWPRGGVSRQGEVAAGQEIRMKEADAR